MPDLPDALTRLEERVEALEQRVAALECPAILRSPAAKVEIPAQESHRESSSTITSTALSVFGRAMLGIAGAYALRAVAESDALPLSAVAAVAIPYALAWLVAASRARAGDWLRSTIYACTAALILAPMLWELTLRFKILTSVETASVLGLFVVVASALGWRRGFISGLWVSYGTAAMLSLTLATATHQIVPFAAVLLLMVMIAEYRVLRGNGGGLRVLAALGADAAIVELIYIYAGPQNAHADYPAIGRFELVAPGVLFFLIFGLDAVVRIVVRRKEITWFDTIQATIAILLAACGVMYFGSQAGTTALGILCLGLSVLGYSALLRGFDREKEKRNSLVFTAWSGALFIAGSLIGLPEWLRAAWIGAAAPVAVFAAARMRRPALELHGVVFLLIAATISGLLLNLWNALAGRAMGMFSWDVCAVAVCALVSYAASLNEHEESSKSETVSIVFAALVSFVVAALMVQGMVAVLALRMIPEAHHLAFLRTLTVCFVATGLALGGAWWNRVEMTRVAYAALVLLAVKLVLEDLRHGHLAFVAGSIFLFAMTLIAVPRAQRIGQRI